VTTVTMRVTLTDNGVKVSWPDLDSVKAFVYSEQQRLVAGACTVEVDGTDDTVLICTYAADKPQYLGPQKAVIVAEYQGQKSTYDKPAFTFVATTAETIVDGTTIAADTTDVDINVEDVSSSILAGAIAAALAAAQDANDAADDATAAAQEARDAAASVPSVDNFYTKPEVDTIAAGKQDKLQSGVNIKTINGESILGEGDIEIQGGDPDAVLYTEQSLTSEQKAQARTNIGAGTYSKPQDGIPSTDLASGVIPDVSNFITKSVNDLVNYYKKTETYTQTEVNNLIAAINQFHYEIAASTSAVTSPASNVLYLIGPTGSGADKYEEYVYDTTRQAGQEWVKIGDTSVDLSGYVTTSALNTALAAYTTTTDLTTLLQGKQDALVDMTFSTFMDLWNDSIAPSS
jgi:hypothetical protein